MRSTIAALALALLAAAAASAQPAPPASPVDGLYVGPVAAVAPSDPNCERYKIARIRVAGGRIDAQKIANQPVSATIGPDGAFSTEANKQFRTGQRRLAVNGTVQNGVLQAEAKTKFCTWHLTLHRTRPRTPAQTHQS
ncbi:MAG TPA: hypothetical protein VFA03_01455 [Acetobacteraceae bacterium]|nr:hypothetical protein [Acetobacteraceae bacterium]